MLNAQMSVKSTDGDQMDARWFSVIKATNSIGILVARLKMSYLKASAAPYVAMLLVQLAYAGATILCKLALQQGMSVLVLTVYRHLIALLLFAPLAFVLERNQRPSSLPFPALAKIFTLAFFGITVNQNVFYAGLGYASPTVASALSSAIPALTFLMAAILRLEEVSVRSAKGRARLLGTILCVGGVLVFTFWKGHLLEGFVRRPLLDVHGRGPRNEGAVNDQGDWLKGTGLILTSFVAFSAWLILQAVVSRVYPARLSMNTLLCFFGLVQSSAMALVFERDASSWRLDWNVQLLAIVYCGIVISVLAYYLQTYCVSEKGPVFAATFSPLLLLMVGLASAFVFAERLHIGSLIGAIIIVVGLYCVLWGKSHDSDENNQKDSVAEQSGSRYDCSL